MLQKKTIKKCASISVCLLITILLTSIIFPISAYSQTNESITNTKNKNSIYLETYLSRYLFMNSLGFASINYERAMGEKNNLNLRVGYFLQIEDIQTEFSFPFTITHLTNATGNQHFEYGIGAVFRLEHYIDPYSFSSKKWYSDVSSVFIPLQYRYQSKSNTNIYLKAGMVIFFGWPIIPTPSISVGYKFENLTFAK